MPTTLTKSVVFNDLAHFTDKQIEAKELLKIYKYILYGGAMGGGKSYWLRWTLVYLLMVYAKKYGLTGVRAGLFCETFPALRDRHLSKIQYEFPTYLGQMNKGENEFVLSPKYGSGVLCFRNLDDPSKYQSSEFATIGVDELTKNLKDVFDFLRTRLRWPGINDTKFLAGSNPGGIGHTWVKKLWMAREFEPSEKEKDLFYFLKAKASDNPHLDASYYTQLDGLPENLRKAFLDGNWDLFVGQYFTEWNVDYHVCQPFAIPLDWRRFRAIDFGRTAPFACLWGAVDYDGKVYIYREFYKAGQNADLNAKEVAELSKGEEYDFTVIDPSVFSKTGQEYSIGEILAQNGLVCEPGDNDRIGGWTLVHQYLLNKKIVFFSNCVNAIRTIPAMIHDERHPEDLDTKGEDHIPDATRYLLKALVGGKTDLPKKTPTVKEELTKVIDKAWQKNSDQELDTLIEFS